MKQSIKKSEKLFYDRKIDENSGAEELKDAYVEYGEVVVDEEGPMSWIALPNSMLFTASYSSRLASNYVKQSHSSILDVGSGLGAHLIYWKSKGFDRVEGCDISLHFSTGYINRGIPYKIVDLNCEDLVLPYRDNEFDIVTCSHTLEHLKYPNIVVEELVRVSKDLVILTGPLGKSYFSVSHIQFWYSPKDIAQSLLKKSWVFSIEFCISSPLKDLQIIMDKDETPTIGIRQMSFIAVIYKQFSSDNPGYREWMWRDSKIIDKLRESRANTFLFLSTEDNLFEEQNDEEPASS
jgi:SAM-dependent methyltransferase